MKLQFSLVPNDELNKSRFDNWLKLSKTDDLIVHVPDIYVGNKNRLADNAYKRFLFYLEHDINKNNNDRITYTIDDGFRTKIIINRGGI